MHASHILTPQRFRKMLLQESCAVPFFCQKLMLRHTFLKNSDAGPRDSEIPGFVGWWVALSLGLSWDIWDAPKMAATINGKIWEDESWWSTMRFCTRTLISDTLRWLGRLRVSDEKGISFASAMPSTFKSTVNAGSDEDTPVDKPGNTKRNDACCWEYSNWLFRFCVNVLHRSPSAFGFDAGTTHDQYRPIPLLRVRPNPRKALKMFWWFHALCIHHNNIEAVEASNRSNFAQDPLSSLGQPISSDLRSPQEALSGVRKCEQHDC